MSKIETPVANIPRARVLVVDDTPSMVAALGDLVRCASELELAGTTDCGEHAIQIADQLLPDMVLMDVRMPGLGGREAAKRIKAAHPSMLVVLVSTLHPYELPREVGEDADAVLWKGELTAEVLDRIWLQSLEGS